MNLEHFGYVAAIVLSACGSALGTGIAGMASIGAWKKCFIQNKPAPFLLIAFVGAPLSQTIYGMILMNAIITAANTDPVAKLGVGVLGGIAIGMSAFFQGKAGENPSHPAETHRPGDNSKYQYPRDPARSDCAL